MSSLEDVKFPVSVLVAAHELEIKTWSQILKGI